MKAYASRLILTVTGVLAWRLSSELVGEHRRLDTTRGAAGHGAEPTAGLLHRRHQRSRPDPAAQRRSAASGGSQQRHADRRDAHIGDDGANDGGAAATTRWALIAVALVGVAGTLYALTNPLAAWSWVVMALGVALAVGAWLLSRPRYAPRDRDTRRSRSRV